MMKPISETRDSTLPSEHTGEKAKGCNVNTFNSMYMNIEICAG